VVGRMSNKSVITREDGAGSEIWQPVLDRVREVGAGAPAPWGEQMDAWRPWRPVRGIAASYLPNSFEAILAMSRTQKRFSN